MTMAAPVTTITHPGSPRFVQATIAPTKGSHALEGLAARTLTHGVVEGLHAQDAGFVQLTVAAGVPLDTDLLSALRNANGVALQPVADKMVYLEIIQKTGVADLEVRLSAANALDIASGTTDTIPVNGGRIVLVDCLADTSTLLTSGIAFDATHKMLKLESTTGCIVEVRAVVV
jgi:hypothetical protein